jgi:hypothetical protein
MIDFLDNLFCKKYWWDFYVPMGFGDKELACSRFLTGKQAIKFSTHNKYVFMLRIIE